jgi:hypothetical protein
MHFLRSLFTNQVRQQNFEICNIETDSCGRKIVTNSIHTDELRQTLNSDNMTLDFPNYIYITYTDRHSELFPLPYIYIPRTYTSILSFTNPLKVFENGYYPDSYSISWGGNMAFDRIAEMLPYDFVPKKLRNE